MSEPIVIQCRSEKNFSGLRIGWELMLPLSYANYLLLIRTSISHPIKYRKFNTPVSKS